jgi:hypothetical protein
LYSAQELHDELGWELEREFYLDLEELVPHVPRIGISGGLQREAYLVVRGARQHDEYYDVELQRNAREVILSCSR